MLHWAWIGVLCFTVLYLVVSGVTTAQKRGWLATAGVVLIFLGASGIVAIGGLGTPKPVLVQPTVHGPAYHEGIGASANDPLGDQQPLILRNDGRTGRVVFTFDDGPDVFTPSMVNELHELRMRAIFFCIGKKAHDNPDTIRMELRDGDIVGNHTWNHKSLTGKGTGSPALNAAEVKDELASTDKAIKSAGAPEPKLWRPPYGAVSVQDAHIASKLGLRLVMDSSFDNSITDSNDWSGLSPAKIAALVEAHIANGSRIIAFHDGISTAPNTIAALPLIVSWMNTHHYMSTVKLPADTTGGWLTPQGQSHQTGGHG